MDDEFVIVISGEVVLVEDEAKPCCGLVTAPVKAGVPNGHAIINRSDDEAVLFEIGTRDGDETEHYPDVDLRYEKRDGIRQFLHRDGTPYEDGLEASRAASPQALAAR